MRMSNQDMNRLIPGKNKESYLSAVKAFTQMTIQNPDFFKKTNEEQVNLAMETIKEHKSEVVNNRKIYKTTE